MAAQNAHVDGPPSTINLYLVDEVLSALQKAIRRTLVDEALFWTLELARSGLGALAMVCSTSTHTVYVQ